MELVAHGTDAAAGDGLPAPAAQCSLALVVMQLTVGTSVQFEEGSSRKTAEAVLGWGWGGEEKEKGCRCQETEHQQSETAALKFLPVIWWMEARILPACKAREQTRPRGALCFVPPLASHQTLTPSCEPSYQLASWPLREEDCRLSLNPTGE